MLLTWVGIGVILYILIAGIVATYTGRACSLNDELDRRECLLRDLDEELERTDSGCDLEPD
jgi:hypothetical protein